MHGLLFSWSPYGKYSICTGGGIESFGLRFYEKRVTVHLFEFRQGFNDWVKMKLKSDIRDQNEIRSRSNTSGHAPLFGHESLQSNLISGRPGHSNMSGPMTVQDGNTYVAL